MATILIKAITVAAVSGLIVAAVLLSRAYSVNVPAQSESSAARSIDSGYVLRADEGEVLQRGKGNTVTVKVDPRTGSKNMAMGTQQLSLGAGIPIHRHEHEDEVLFVHDGRGVAILEDQRKPVGKGDTVYVPRGVWHGVETEKEGVHLLWIVTPPGLESFFREISVPLGKEPKALTPAQIEDIGRKHGLRFKRN